MPIAALVIFGWILSVCLHEFGHAVVAYAGGDTSVKDKGYLTLNIFKYTDPGLTLFFPVLILLLGGIALPGAAVYIDHSRLRGRFWESAVAAAGPISNSVIAIALALPFMIGQFPTGTPAWVLAGIAFLTMLQISAVLLNSLPIPPFDGYGVIEPWLPSLLRDKMRTFGRYGMWLVFLAFWTVPAFNDAFWGIIFEVTKLLHIPPVLVQVGYEEFHKNSAFLMVPLLAILFLMRKKEPKPTDIDLYNAGRQLFANDRPDLAIAAFDQAIKLRPEFPEAWHMRGLAYGMMSKNKEAMESFDKALSIKPDFADCWYNRACCLALQGEADQSLTSLEHAIQLNPEPIKLHAQQDIGFQRLWDDKRFKELVDTDRK